jgi:hypothetical protein
MGRKFVGRTVRASLAVVATSCGGGGGAPTTPVLPTPRPSGWTTGTVVTVTSGETDAPVAGARVLVAGAPYTTDGSGQARVQATAEGAQVDIEAKGFLGRQTLVRHAVTRLTLWPDAPELPSDYTRALVYTASSTSDTTSLVPLERLPPRIRTLALEPSDRLKADRWVMDAHRKAAAYFNMATEGRVFVTVGGTADMTVPTRIDTADPVCEGSTSRLFANIWASGHEVSRAEIVFCSEGPTRLPSPIAHELGHIYGLGHSPNGFDLMYPYYDALNEHGFTEREMLTMGLIELRRGGNTWPDNDRTAATLGTRLRVVVD